MAQIKEFTSSVDNTERYGIHKDLVGGDNKQDSLVKELDNKIDTLINSLDLYDKTTQRFKTSYQEQLVEKSRKMDQESSEKRRKDNLKSGTGPPAFDLP